MALWSNSVPDLAASLNRILAARALGPLAQPAVAAMVGDGVQMLLQRAFASLGRTPDPQAVADFTADYAAHVAEATRPYPGIAAMLAAARAEGWRMAVCTNKPERLAHAVLAATGLADYFAAVGGGDSFPVRKPDPGHMLATLRAAGAEASHAVMLGDHHNDILAAAGAGMPCLFAAWGYGGAGAAAGAAAIAHGANDVLELADQVLGAQNIP